jgi:hypothetical protein
VSNASPGWGPQTDIGTKGAAHLRASFRPSLFPLAAPARPGISELVVLWGAAISVVRGDL